MKRVFVRIIAGFFFTLMATSCSYFQPMAVGGSQRASYSSMAGSLLQAGVAGLQVVYNDGKFSVVFNGQLAALSLSQSVQGHVSPGLYTGMVPGYGLGYFPFVNGYLEQVQRVVEIENPHPFWGEAYIFEDDHRTYRAIVKMSPCSRVYVSLLAGRTHDIRWQGGGGQHDVDVPFPTFSDNGPIRVRAEIHNRKGCF